MKTPAISPNRIAVGLLAAGVVGVTAASAAGTMSPAADAAPANCTAGGLATTASGVLGQAGGYLADHPDANDTLTAAASMPTDQAKSSVTSYFLGHPGEFLDLQNIAQPLMNMKSQCGVDLSAGQLATLIDTITK
ncbi:MAG TPA: heme-binding protein [Mycobacterium sp.]|nr:heme-binding protein [Mycobacterium sp.]